MVVDTSVVIKWFFDEAGHEEAREIFRNVDELSAPDLLRYEFINILVVKKTNSAKEAKKFFTDFSNLPIEIYALNQSHLFSSIELAKKYSIALYDASFLALAESLNVDFITADLKLVSKVKQLSYVHLL